MDKVRSITDSNGVTRYFNYQEVLTDTDGGYGQRIKAVETALANLINFEAEKF